MEKNKKYYTTDKRELISPVEALADWQKYYYKLSDSDKAKFLQEAEALNNEGVRENYSCKILQFIFRDNYHEMKERILKYDGISEDD